MLPFLALHNFTLKIHGIIACNVRSKNLGLYLEHEDGPIVLQEKPVRLDVAVPKSGLPQRRQLFGLVTGRIAAHL